LSRPNHVRLARVLPTMSPRPAAFVVVLSSALVLLASAPAGAIGGWTVVPSPNPSAQANYLTAAASISPNDVWAVGTEYQPSGSAGTLAEHWDGTAWKAVRTPNPQLGYNELFGVDAASSTDVWAVGYASVGPFFTDSRTLVQHWDGTRWSNVRSPNLGTRGNALNAISVVSANDIWAVGLGDSPSTNSGQPIIVHWDGTAWTLVSSVPTGSGFAELRAIDAVSANDIWAVGYRGKRTLIEHWDGSTWSLVASPALQTSYLLGVTAVATDDVWAVGSSAGKSLVEHWDGSAWTRVPSPNAGKPVTQLSAVAQFGSSDIWAVGLTVDELQVSLRTVTEHWDGTSWSLVASPNPSTEYDQLVGVTGIAGGDIWAVGQDEDTLVLRRQDA
jgi:hypothetical protein